LSLLKRKLAKILQEKNRDLDYGLGFNFEYLPFNLDKLRKNFQETVLEIGTGWGEFTLENAALHPDSLFIAVEKKRHRIVDSIKRQKSLGIKNIRWLVLDVQWFFLEVFKEQTFEKIIINFPDPWPKKRHHKHRFIQENRIKDFEKVIKVNGSLEFGTDYYEYARDVLFLLEGSKQWQNLNGRFSLLSEIPQRPISYFQQLKKKEGFPSFFLQFQIVDKQNTK
jgi:tRNA (guanine-N7-)-methyltransferase